MLAFNFTVMFNQFAQFYVLGFYLFFLLMPLTQIDWKPIILSVALHECLGCF